MSVISKFSLYLAAILVIFPITVKAENLPQNIEPLLVALKNQYSNSAYGSLEQKEWNELYQTHYRCRQSDSCDLSLSEVQGILGFYGEKFRIYRNGDIQDWIWIDSKKHNRQIKATFVDGYLTKLKRVGF